MFLLNLQARLQHAWDLGCGGQPKCRKSATLHSHVEGFSSSLLHRLSQQHLQSPSSSQNSERYEITADFHQRYCFVFLIRVYIHNNDYFCKSQICFWDLLLPLWCPFCFDQLYEMFKLWWIRCFTAKSPSVLNLPLTLNLPFTICSHACWNVFILSGSLWFSPSMVLLVAYGPEYCFTWPKSFHFLFYSF